MLIWKKINAWYDSLNYLWRFIVFLVTVFSIIQALISGYALVEIFGVVVFILFVLPRILLSLNLDVPLPDGAADEALDAQRPVRHKRVVVGKAAEQKIVMEKTAVVKVVVEENKDRFCLFTATDHLDLLIITFIEALKGNGKKARIIFAGITWTPEEVEGWSDEKRTIAHYFANKLAQHHLGTRAEIMHALAAANHDAPGISAWYEAIRRDTGYPHTKGVEAPADCDGFEYVNWILGLDYRPVVGPWRKVPLAGF